MGDSSGGFTASRAASNVEEAELSLRCGFMEVREEVRVIVDDAAIEMAAVFRDVFHDSAPFSFSWWFWRSHCG